MTISILLLLLLFNGKTAHGTANNSLSNCNTLVASFNTTCGGTAAASVTVMAGVNVTCTSGFTSSTCPGTYTGSTCIFTHKLCVTCSGTSPVRIRVQSNGLPLFCPNSPNAISEQNIDFTVNYNPDVSVNSPNQSPTTLVALDAIVCNINNQQTVPSGSNFVNNGGSLNTLAGVSVDGVSIYNVNSANDVDPFYPPNTADLERVDACLGHPNVNDVYHYHIASGCALNPPSGSILPCAGTSACSASIANYSISLFSSYRTQTVIGIAKDGHVIYGPYYSTGAEVTTGFDMCNGVFYDSVGNYAYFATRTFPYITGCFGPGNYPSVLPDCTTNPPSGYAMSSYASQFVTNSTTNTTAVTTTTTKSKSKTLVFDCTLLILTVAATVLGQ